MESKVALDLLKEPINKLIKGIGKELEQAITNRLLEYQAEEYRRNFYSKTILHRIEPKSLEEFYQPLFIINRGAIKPTESVSQLFSKHNFITLIGSAGSGKSTIVKYLFINSIKEKFKIPIKIELRYLNDFEGSLQEYIYQKIFMFHKLGVSNSIIDRLLNSGDFIFFFDGYDEIDSNSKLAVTKSMDEFVQKYGSNKYLLTSRPYTHIELLPQFTNFEVCNLEDDEIVAFIQKQLPKEESELTQKIILAIDKKENSGYKTFLSNPLLLSMFILTFQSYSDIPEKKSEFYSQVFDALFSLHDSMSKMAYTREKMSGLNKEHFEELLRLFSFISFFEEKFVFSQAYITEKFELIKKMKKSVDFDNEKLIADLQVAICILNKEGLDYLFPHRSLQEYFAASYVKTLGVENKKKFYGKLQTEIESNYMSLFRRDNFLNLLYELDFSAYTRYLAIPLIQKNLNGIFEIKRFTAKNSYQYYCKLTFLSDFIMGFDKKWDLIFDKFFVEGLNIMFKGDGINQFVLTEEEIYRDNSEDNVKKVIQSIKSVKSSGKEIIASMEQILNDIDKGDEAILDLIS